MKQVQFRSFGPPSQVATCIDVPDPTPPTAWEVMVDIEAFPINPADLAMLAGRYGKLPTLPATIGMEAVGRISQKGNSVKDLQIGDRVVILANNNWAERRKVPAAAVHRVPNEGDVAQYCMLKVNPATAYLMLNQFAKVAEDEWIIQNAPLSGVGRCVMQLARNAKIRTLNIVRRPEAKPEVLALGGDAAIEDGPDLAARVRAITKHRPPYLALDALGGDHVQRMAESLCEGGKVVNYGMLTGEPCMIHPELTVFRGISLVGFWVSNVLNRLARWERDELFAKLSGMIESQTLRMAVDSQFTLDEIQAAIRRAEISGRHGKVIVNVVR